MLTLIRVEPRKRAAFPVVHALVDPGRTFCGRSPDDLHVSETWEALTLPPKDGCHGCLRGLVGWTPEPPGSRGFGAGALRVTAASAPGRARRTGPLVHGTGRPKGHTIHE